MFEPLKFYCTYSLGETTNLSGQLGPISQTIRIHREWSGGAKVLGKLSVPGRPTSLDDSRARTYALAVGAGGGCLDIFFPLIYLFSFLSPSLWETA